MIKFERALVNEVASTASLQQKRSATICKIILELT